MLTNPARPVGFRSTNQGIGWRVWVGPVMVARTRATRFGYWSARRAGWRCPRHYALTLFGLSLSVGR